MLVLYHLILISAHTFKQGNWLSHKTIVWPHIISIRLQMASMYNNATEP